MDVIDIGASNIGDPISIDVNDNTVPSSNVSFGSGIELLMNDKNKSSSNDSIKIDLGDLNDLENELNELSSDSQTKNETTQNKDAKTLTGMASDLFGLGGFSKTNDTTSEPLKMNLDSTTSNIGQATSESIGNSKTWDGFSKMNDVPSMPSMPSMSDREKRRKKRSRE